jgi:hypothetical protein
MSLKFQEELGPLSKDQIKKMNSLKSELWKILDDEELYYHKRCRETWLLKADNNTNFFIR